MQIVYTHVNISSILTSHRIKGKNKHSETALSTQDSGKSVPAHNPPLILLHNLAGATRDGKPYRTAWTVFTIIRIDGQRDNFTAAVFRDHFTGEEVVALLRNSCAYPAVVMIQEDYGIFQRFETYDTDPLRPVEKGFVAIRLEGYPDAMIPAELAIPAEHHVCDAHDTKAV